MIYSGIAATIFALEFFIKKYVEKNKVIGKEELVLHNRLIIEKHHNKGAFLNIFDRYQKVVAALSVGLTVFILLLGTCAWKEPGKSKAGKGQKLEFAFLLGGALSNTYDRVFRGYVVDYCRLNVKQKKIRNIIFNIGDFFIMLGSMFLSIFSR